MIDIHIAQEDALKSAREALHDWVGQRLADGVSTQAIADATHGVDSILGVLVPAVVGSVLQHILDHGEVNGLQVE